MFGSIYITSDIKMVENALFTRSAKVVILDEENPFPNSDIVTMGSILLPPYEALAAMVDGEMAIFQQIYIEYLQRMDVEKFMVLLITALYRGINLLMFIPDQESDFIGPLLFHFSSLGVIVGSPRCMFTINPAQEPNRLMLMYLHGFISTFEYLTWLPDMVPINRIALPLLINDINPHLNSEYTEDAYLRFFEDYRRKIKNSNKPVIVPFMRCN